MASMQQVVERGGEALEGAKTWLSKVLASQPSRGLQLPGGEKATLAYKARKCFRKFGPLGLIITLLFAIEYFLISIYFNVHHIKHHIPLRDGEAFPGLLQGSTAMGRQWAQHRMVGRGTYGFVQWSAYRTSPSDIVAVGFGSTRMRDARKVSSCTWHGEEGVSVPGTAAVLYPESKDDKHQYEVIIVTCALRGAVQSRLGGQLSVTIDQERTVLYREEADSVVLPSADSLAKPKAAFCTFPIVEPVDGERLREWLDLHKYIGAEKVFAYDAGGMDKEAASHLFEYLRDGFLEMTPMREIVQFNVPRHGKLLAMHDCLYRSSLVASWAVFLDWDSVLFLKSPRFLSILLEDHKDLAWMTYGSRMFSTKLCLSLAHVDAKHESHAGTAGGTVAYPHERMVYHWPHFVCYGDEPKVPDEMCPGKRGGRNLIVNTKKVTLLGIAEVVQPAEGGMELSAEDVRSDRFENIHIEGMSERWCKQPHEPDDHVDWWLKSTEVQELVQEARKDQRGKKEPKS